MLNITGKYISVFDVTEKDRYIQANLSSSKKQRDGSYKHMSWRARFVGNAVDSARALQNKDKIEITNGLIENNVDDNGRYWYNVIIFDFVQMS